MVMGSYERGTRAISLSRTIEIADLFGIPVTELISDGTDQSRTETAALVFDLRAIERLSSFNDSTEIRHISRYLKALALRRPDWNGEVLSLRKSDFEQFSLLLDATEENLFQQLSDYKVLLRGPSHL